MASSSTAAGAGAGPPAILRLKFIFANHDGVVVEYETEPTTLIKDLKVALVGRWPPGEGERERENDKSLQLSNVFPAIRRDANPRALYGAAQQRARRAPRKLLHALLSVGRVCRTLQHRSPRYCGLLPMYLRVAAF